MPFASILLAIITFSTFQCGECGESLKEVAEFPEDHLGKSLTFACAFVNTEENCDRWDEAKGFWLVLKDRPLRKAITSPGPDSVDFDKGKLVVVITKEQARDTVKKSGQRAFVLAKVTLTISKETIDGKELYVGRVSALEKE